jgi:hypothetical protein
LTTSCRASATSEGAQKLAAEVPDSEVVVLAGGFDRGTGVGAVLAGAAGYISRGIAAEALPRIVRAVMRGETAIPRSLTTALIERYRMLARSQVGMRPTKTPLSSREWEVLDLMATSNASKDGEELVLRAGATPSSLPLDPPVGPAPLAAFEKGDHKVVLAGKVAVERRLGDPGALDQLVDSHRPDTTPREQLVGGLQDAVADGTHAGGGWEVAGHRPSIALVDRPVFLWYKTDRSFGARFVWHWRPLGLAPRQVTKRGRSAAEARPRRGPLSAR